MLLKMVVLTLFAGLSLLAAPADSAGPPPVPEPATVVLLGMGLAGIGYASWRKNRKKQ